MYKLMFFSLDGDHVVEGEFNTIAEANDRWADIGSRWFFYPIGAIFGNDNHLAVFSEELIDLNIEHATVDGFKNAITANQEYLQAVMA